MAPVDTSVNSHQWPVPIPSTVNLKVVRQEARLCGAEYCWLDVLCLRQPKMTGVSEVDRELRLKEWEVDIPTIGNIFCNATGVLRYFNGLGRRFDMNSAAWSDSRHWANRAWTLQEMRPEEEMVNAGITVGNRLSLSTPLFGPEGTTTLRTMLKPLSDLGLAVHSPHGCSIIELTQHMSKRFATNPVDKIAGINYLIWPQGWSFDLPIYNPMTRMEDAWLRCVQSMRRDLKVELLFLFPYPRQKSTTRNTKVNSTWIPTWAQIAEFTGNVWADLSLCVISEDAYSNPLHPLIVPTLLWSLREPLGTLVFDDCRITTAAFDNAYNIILGATCIARGSFHVGTPPSITHRDEAPASESDASAYRRLLKLEKKCLLRTDERLLIEQKFPSSLPMLPRSFLADISSVMEFGEGDGMSNKWCRTIDDDGESGRRQERNCSDEQP
ncbi:hypothetical protein BDZ91DRAFT_760807 [Kalaharituber pfeilii]|nr:hypothetical protein BDZ91DRAFT_760807 [Kalaharituber pfeilii]